MNTKLDGPLVSAFEAEIEGVIKQEFITYRVKDGMLRKETVKRNFGTNGDYIDSSEIVPLMEVEDAT